MIDISLSGQSICQSADIKFSARLGSLRTSMEEVLRTKLGVGGVTQWKDPEAAQSPPKLI